MLFDGLELPADLKRADVIVRVNERLQAVSLERKAQLARWGCEWLFNQNEAEQFKSAILGYELSGEDDIFKLLAIAPFKRTSLQIVKGCLLQALRNPVFIEFYQGRRKTDQENVPEGVTSIVSAVLTSESQVRFRANRNWSLVALVLSTPLIETETEGKIIRWPTLK